MAEFDAVYITRNFDFTGSNARCIAFMNAMKRVICDYSTPDDRELSRDLDSKLKTHITFLKGCRNHSTSMGNAIRFLKAKIRKVEAGTPEAEAKEALVESIERFVHDIHLSAVQISITACEKIRDGDVILTYGWYVEKFRLKLKIRFTVGMQFNRTAHHAIAIKRAFGRNK